MIDDLYARYGLDPLADATTLTERFRALLRDAPGPAEEAALREAWEALTLHPRRRLEAALRSPPESHPASGRAPRTPRRRRAPALAEALASLTEDDLVAWPALTDTMPPARELPVCLSDLLERSESEP